MTFDSPYMKSKYKSAVIKLENGDEELIRDFN